MVQAQIYCSHVFVGYERVSIVQDCSFSASSGEFVAILGPNGSGKTTLLRALSGILPCYSGKISLCGQDVQSISSRARAKLVAVVPQKLDTVPHMTVQDMVLLGRYPYTSWLGMYSAEDYVVAEQVMQETDIVHFAQRFLEELSGGELQRVLLARAFAQQSPILLLDEPSAALDVARMQDVFRLLEKKRQAGALIISVMHDINLAALYATRLLGIHTGRVLFDGAVEDVLTEEHVRALYGTRLHVFRHPTLGVPQVCPDR